MHRRTKYRYKYLLSDIVTDPRVIIFRFLHIYNKKNVVREPYGCSSGKGEFRTTKAYR